MRDISTPARRVLRYSSRIWHLSVATVVMRMPRRKLFAGCSILGIHINIICPASILVKLV
jgi:hypothetical protein